MRVKKQGKFHKAAIIKGYYFIGQLSDFNNRSRIGLTSNIIKLFIKLIKASNFLSDICLIDYNDITY